MRFSRNVRRKRYGLMNGFDNIRIHGPEIDVKPWSETVSATATKGHVELEVLDINVLDYFFSSVLFKLRKLVTFCYILGRNLDNISGTLLT